MFSVFKLNAQTLDFDFINSNLSSGDTLLIKNTSTGFSDSVVFVFEYLNFNIGHPKSNEVILELNYLKISDTLKILVINSGTFNVKMNVLDTINNPMSVQKNIYIQEKYLSCSLTYNGCNAIRNRYLSGPDFGWGSGHLFWAYCWDNASLVGGVISPYQGADYYSSLAPVGNSYKIPNTFAGYQQSVGAGRMAGFVAYIQDDINSQIPNSTDYARNYREYPTTMIINPSLIPGQLYYASMDVSLAETSKIAVKNIGMYFGWSSTQSVRNNGQYNIPQTIQRSPQIVSQTIVNNTTDWTRIEGEFLSTGGNCLHIGNFSNDEDTEIQVLDGNQTFQGQYVSYYFLDNVQLKPIHENTNETITYCHTDEVTISSKLHIQLRNTFLWNTGATTASIIVNPTIPTTYTVTATDVYGCTKIDSYNIIPAYEPVEPVLSGNLNNCEQINTYTIINEQPNTIYTWVPTNYTAMTGNNATKTITWDIANFPELPNYATITINSNNGCQSSNVYKVWNCCQKTGAPIINGQTITSSLGSGDYYLNGTITIDGDLTFNYVNLYMGPEAKINVTPNSNITFTNSTLESGCLYMWDGLTLNPTSSITMNSSYLGDAISGIVSNGGAPFNLTNTLFNRNLYSVVVNNYSSSHLGTVSKCTFYSMDFEPQLPLNLLNPYSNRRSIAGVKISDVNNIQIGNTDNIANQNVFKYLDYGVYIDNSNVTLYNNSFGPMPQTAGTAIPENGYGVYAINGNVNGNTLNIGSTSTNTVYANNFSDCAIGVYALNNYNMNVYRNTFTSPTQTMKFGIFMMEHGYRTITIANNSFTNPSLMGVWALNIPYATININDNKFYNSVAGTNETQFNIAVSNIVLSKINTVNIEGNYMYNNWTYGVFKTGIAISNLEGFIDLALNRHYPFIFGNTISYSSSIDVTGVSTKRCGIRVENCRNANIEQNTISCASTISNETKASRLTGIYVIASPSTALCKNIVDHRGFGIQFDGNSSGSKIIRNDLTNNYYGYKFVDATIGNQNLNRRPNDNKWIGFAIAQRRANGTLATSTSWTYRTPNTDYRLQTPYDYYNIPTLTTSISNPVLFNDCAYTPGGGSTSMLAGISNMDVELQETEYFINQVENEYYDKFNSEGLLSNVNQSNNEVALDGDMYSNIPLFKTVNECISIRNYNMADSINNFINPVNIIEKNMKTVNEIYLRTWAKGNWNIPATDYFTLIDIALQSPITSGYGVVSAWIMTQRFDNTNDVVESQKANVKIKHNTNIVISPNPAKDQIQVDGIEQISIIAIYDVFGREMLTQLNNEKKSTVINTSSLIKGVYFVCFTNKISGDILVEKIIIQ